MHAIQFRTYARHGTIKIPELYQEWQDRELTVILLIPEEETTQRQQRFFESVKKHSFKLPKDYQFNREELHER
jgi:hypothetical protein